MTVSIRPRLSDRNLEKHISTPAGKNRCLLNDFRGPSCRGTWGRDARRDSERAAQKNLPDTEEPASRARDPANLDSACGWPDTDGPTDLAVPKMGVRAAASDATFR